MEEIIEEIKRLIKQAIEVINGDRIEFPHMLLGPILEDQTAKIEKARALFEKIPNTNPEKPILANKIGVILNAMGLPDKAAEYFRRALVLLPGSNNSSGIPIESNLFHALLNKGNFDAAFNYMMQSLDANSDECNLFDIERYVPKKILGVGGMGVSFLCEDIYEERPVVIKTLWRHATGTLKEVFAEAFTAKKLDDSRILRFYDIRRHKGNRPFIVTEYFEGTDLHRYIIEERQGQPVDLLEALQIIAEVARGIAVAHEAGTPIIHRDIKPNNILYNPKTGSVKIIDFGIACVLPPVDEISRSISTTSQSVIAQKMAGTWGYMAPEQQRGEENLDPRVDIFSLGKTLMFLLTGKTPPPENIFALSAETREYVGEFVGYCLMPHAHERYDSQKAIAQIEEILDKYSNRPPMEELVDEEVIEEIYDDEIEDEEALPIATMVVDSSEGHDDIVENPIEVAIPARQQTEEIEAIAVDSHQEDEDAREQEGENYAEQEFSNDYVVPTAENYQVPTEENYQVPTLGDYQIPNTETNYADEDPLASLAVPEEEGLFDSVVIEPTPDLPGEENIDDADLGFESVVIEPSFGVEDRQDDYSSLDADEYDPDKTVAKKSPPDLSFDTSLQQDSANFQQGISIDSSFPEDMGPPEDAISTNEVTSDLSGSLPLEPTVDFSFDSTQQDDGFSAPQQDFSLEGLDELGFTADMAADPIANDSFMDDFSLPTGNDEPIESFSISDGPQQSFAAGPAESFSISDGPQQSFVAGPAESFSISDGPQQSFALSDGPMDTSWPNEESTGHVYVKEEEDDNQDLMSAAPFDKIDLPPGFSWEGELVFCERDCSHMVYIPAGVFTIGSSEEEASPGEGPEHILTMSQYLIDQFPVTWGQYKHFCRATNRSEPVLPCWDVDDDQPVVNVSWDDANEYARWAGKVLPSEAQWEKAARGGHYFDGDTLMMQKNKLPSRRYPWGNAMPNDKAEWRCVCRQEPQYGERRPAPIGTFEKGASPYGCLDMVGGVWEWCNDWYSDTYYQSCPDTDPRGPRTGDARVLRGGAWNSDFMHLTNTFRSYMAPEEWWNIIGFRTAFDIK